ncbi:MAG: hypothetical protein GY866_23475 [Proteobacteria bacterium]|nr:hypothetical protein [Pseudomonadota bacterium]
MKAGSNIGAVPIVGEYNLQFWGKDQAKGIAFDEMKAPLPNHTSAQCEKGYLFVADQSGGPFEDTVMGKNYHGLDYGLFYMNTDLVTFSENISAIQYIWGFAENWTPTT